MYQQSGMPYFKGFYRTIYKASEVVLQNTVPNLYNRSHTKTQTTIQERTHKNATITTN